MGDHVVTVVIPSAAKRSSPTPSSYRLGAAPLCDAYRGVQRRKSHDRRSRAGQAGRSRYMGTAVRPLRVAQACDAVSLSPFEPRERAGSRVLARDSSARARVSRRAPSWTTPGVGRFGALLILAEIGDVLRFPDARHLVSYAGLAPSVHSSGGRTYHGRITKQGSPLLRWILV
jgi:transposase